MGTFGGFELEGQYLTFLGGTPVEVKGMPRLLLEKLVENVGAFVPESACRDAMQMSDKGGNVADHVSEIRRLLVQAAGGQFSQKQAQALLENVRGKGYRLNHRLEGHGQVGDASVLREGELRAASLPPVPSVPPKVSASYKGWGGWVPPPSLIVLIVLASLAALAWNWIGRRPPTDRRERVTDGTPITYDACPDETGMVEITKPKADGHVSAGDIRVEWDPAGPMVLQWYQDDKCHPAEACRVSGGNKTSTTPATLKIPTQGPTQLKIWTPNAPAPANCIWVTLE